ncbi:MAG: undecaprenyl-phosphate glucose phosphotransferase [Phycisphaerales bacterium]
MVKQRHELFAFLLGVSDVLVISAACVVAWLVRHAYAGLWLPYSWEGYFKEPLIPLTVPITMITMHLLGLYRPRRDRSIWSEMSGLVKASVVAVGLVVVVMWVMDADLLAGRLGANDVEILGYHTTLGRVQLGCLAITLPAFLCGYRAVFRLALRRLRSKGRNLRHVAVIGVGRLGQIVGRTLGRNTWTGLNVAYFISHEPTADRGSCLTRPVRGGLDDLERTLDEHKVDGVYLALPNTCAAEVPTILARLERFAVDVRLIPDVPPRYLPHSMSVSELDGMPILSCRECPLYGLGGFSKRMLDVLGSAAALVLFSPVMLLIAIGVRLSGPGPIIFKQRRVSLGGETFKIYKFRTMYHVEDERRELAEQTAALAEETPAVPGWTARNDPRVTPLGRFLRRTSLDELPQFLNVLKGQMSLVGPRPERPELIERFRDDWRGYMLRQHVKAGITGWAQVRGLRGDTDLRKRLQHDLFYIRHWSLWFDVKILWLTLFNGFLHRNAH